MAMQVFLTGATGFVGGHVLRELASRGHLVRALVRNRKKLEGNQDFIDRVVDGDLSDTRALEEGVAGAEAVIHVAGLLAASSRKQFRRVNAEGTHRVLQAASRVAKGLERFVYVSSISAAGPSRPGEPLVEDDPPEPISWYGESKLEGEREARRFEDRFGVTIIRPPIVYGPGDTGTLPFFKMVQSGRVFSVGDPAMQVSLIYATDLARAIVDAIEKPQASGETFFVSGDARPRVKELVQGIEEALGQEASIIRLPTVVGKVAMAGAEVFGRLGGNAGLAGRDKLKELMAPGWLCSNKRIKSVLGWRAEVDFKEGLRRSAEWYIEKGWLKR